MFFLPQIFEQVTESSGSRSCRSPAIHLHGTHPPAPACSSAASHRSQVWINPGAAAQSWLRAQPGGTALLLGAMNAPEQGESPALDPWGGESPLQIHTRQNIQQPCVKLNPSPSYPRNAAAAAHAVLRGVERCLQGLQVPGVHPPHVAGSLLQRLVAHVALWTDRCGAGSTHSPCPRKALTWTFSFPLLHVS